MHYHCDKMNAIDCDPLGVNRTFRMVTEYVLRMENRQLATHKKRLINIHLTTQCDCRVALATFGYMECARNIARYLNPKSNYLWGRMIKGLALWRRFDSCTGNKK